MFRHFPRDRLLSRIDQCLFKTALVLEVQPLHLNLLSDLLLVNFVANRDMIPLPVAIDCLLLDGFLEFLLEVNAGIHIVKLLLLLGHDVDKEVKLHLDVLTQLVLVHQEQVLHHFVSVRFMQGNLIRVQLQFPKPRPQDLLKLQRQRLILVQLLKDSLVDLATSLLDKLC